MSFNDRNQGHNMDVHEDLHAFETMSLDTYLLIHNVKLYWIAFFSLWVYWGLLWFLRHAFGDGHLGGDYAPQRAPPTSEVQEAEVQGAEEATPRGGFFRKRRFSRTHSRLSRASDVLRDLVLLLLSVLTLHTLAKGTSIHTVMILSWVFFAFAVVWSIFEASYEHHLARFVYAVLFYGLALAIGALAFKHGFHTFYD